MERTFDPAGSSCRDARELISASADGALDADETPRLEAHLASCPDCAAYRTDVVALARSTRMRAVQADPAFVSQVMRSAQPARLGRGGWLRPALAWCGLLVAVQGVGPLMTGEVDGAASHLARHVGASTLALAVGLLYVAWRPHRADGLLPYVGALFATMSLGALFDVTSGDRAVLSEAVHLSELVGLVLVWMIAGSPGWDRFAGVVRRRARHAHAT